MTARRLNEPEFGLHQLVVKQVVIDWRLFQLVFEAAGPCPVLIFSVATLLGVVNFEFGRLFPRTAFADI